MWETAQGHNPRNKSAKVGRAHLEPYIVCAEKKQIQKQYEIVQMKAAIQKCLVVIFTKKKKKKGKKKGKTSKQNEKWTAFSTIKLLLLSNCIRKF